MDIAGSETHAYFKFVDVGEYTSCGITSGGLVYCWGKNDVGQLGQGTRSSGEQSVPLQIAGGRRYKQLSVGENHACAIATSGKTYCWGDNRRGQLGNETNTPSLVPTEVATNLAFSSVAAGASNTCALRADGALYCWGWNHEGAVGTGQSREDWILSPVPVAGGLRFRQVSVGSSHVCGVTIDDRGYCWGDGAEGKLGNGWIASVSAPSPVMDDLPFAMIRAGGLTTCGITKTGAAYCWGSNADGALGRGDEGGSSMSPVKVITNQSFASISTGAQYSCAITSGEEAYCWGQNTYGTLGTGDQVKVYVPTRVAAERHWSSVEVHGLHACGRTTHGETLCWGSQTNGELGLANPPDQCFSYGCAMVPTRIDDPR